MQPTIYTHLNRAEYNGNLSIAKFGQQCIQDPCFCLDSAQDIRNDSQALGSWIGFHLAESNSFFKQGKPQALGCLF